MTETVEDLGPLPYASKVEAMAGYGLSAADIAQVLDIEVTELKASYEKELAGGQIKANARVAESLYRKAIGEGRESVTAAIFWLKTRARWKEISVHEHVAPQEPITVSDTARFVEWMIESSESVASQERAARVEQARDR
jgi:hypothetical protein